MLLSILNNIGLSELTSNLLLYYLTTGCQELVYKGDRSSFFNISKGVPQGSVVDPLIFRIYILNFPFIFMLMTQSYVPYSE